MTSACRPGLALRRPNAMRYAESPRNASTRGFRRSTFFTSARAPARSSDSLNESAEAEARGQMLVRPQPRASSRSCSKAVVPGGTKPAPASAGQKRLPGRAKCSASAAE